MEAERFYRPIFVVTLALASLALVAGISHSLLTLGELPPLDRDYLTYIEETVEAKDYASAIDQLRIASELEFWQDSPARTLVQVARVTGDLDSEIYALRIVQRHKLGNIDVLNSVSSALLERGSLTVEDAKKLIRNSRSDLQKDPSSADAHRYLAEAYWVQGDNERAVEHFREAARLDASLTGDQHRLGREPRGY